MAKHKRHARRRNPTGTILVNPRRGGARRKLSLRSLFGKRNPSRKRRSHSKRRNPILVNRGRKRSHSKRRARRNPITFGNPRRRRSVARRRNPGNVVSGFLAKIQGMFRRLPVIGGALSAAIGGFGSALFGAVGVLPTQMAMPYIAKYLPSWFRPYAYSAAGALLGGIVKVLPFNFPMKGELSVGLAAAGGAVDMYRYRHGKSQDLGDTYDLTYAGDGDYGDIDGDDGFGDDGSPLAAVEYAGCDLQDADYAGDDLSADEIGAAELGRTVYRKRFQAHRAQPGQVSEGEPNQAGMPGERWGWLIYWIGMDAFQKLSKMPEAQRKKIIRDLKHEARLMSNKLLAQDEPTSVAQAEIAGLLVAA